MIASKSIQINTRDATLIVSEPEQNFDINIKAKNLTIVDNRNKNLEEILIPKADYFDYIYGNPPFIGSKMMSPFQRNQIVKEFGDAKGSGVLDYVTGWYSKAAQYIQNSTTKVAFVSTNSIVQGEQTGILWKYLLQEQGVKIHFAHRTFKWSNEAKGVAAVYCVIIGFAHFDTAHKRIFDYENIQGEAYEIKAKNINPYLVDAVDVFINRRNQPLSAVPKMSFGNMPLDGGHLLFTDEEKKEFLKTEAQAEQFILPLISAREFLNGKKRWCLWLVDAKPNELKQLPEVLKRVEKVRSFRQNSVAPSTQKFALTPTLFRDRNRPESYILIPSTSSERRKYIPMGFLGINDIANNSCHIIPEGTLYHFGVLMSLMHMAWVKYIGGRLKSDYRYSKDIVYNNFPWPENLSEKQIAIIEKKALQVLDIRARFPESSLADLYDPLTMPIALLKAHQELDKVIDEAYHAKPFKNNAERMAVLLKRYQKLVESNQKQH